MSPVGNAVVNAGQQGVAERQPSKKVVESDNDSVAELKPGKPPIQARKESGTPDAQPQNKNNCKSI